MELKFNCNNCEKEVLVSNTIIKNEKEFVDKDRQSIFITYFDCPNCCKRHFVQIDNGKTLNLKRENIKMFRKLSKLRQANKQIPKQQSDKFSKLREKLAKERNELMEQYTNNIVTDTETGENIKLSFTVL